MLKLPAAPDLGIPALSKPQTIAFAAIAPCKGVGQPDCLGFREYTGETVAEEIADLACVECVVARVADRGQTTLVDRSNTHSRVLYIDEEG